MSVTGLCHVCQSAEARFTCGRCGSLVCGDHYDRSMGFCVECSTETTGGGQRDPSSDIHR